ncbi:mitochondrial antiviral-signaling protein [Alligator mississippiensis]|uniref:mitochondrial antiviral-signaling protein n=1 Tax=Alligator mississippiensis TaxID=8496 RepID=UPI002877F0BA|nr:mitochondrial antiviral-signaling protein [Alligator mississippiensis]
MTFAEDEVYKYVKRNMSKFHVIRVEQMLPFVSASLSVPDVEEIRAVLNSKGNHVAVWDFIDFLRRRQGWVEVFINALYNADFWALGEEVQRVYDAVQVRPAVPSSHQATRSPSTSSLACSRTPPPAESPGSRGPGIASPLPRKPVTPASCPPSVVATDSAAEGCRDLKVETPEKVPECTPAPPWQVVSPQQVRNISVGDVQASYRSSDPGNISLPPLESQQDHREVPAGQAGLVELDMPSEQTQSWPSRQQQPVCVNNGYFGNMNHLSSGAGSRALVTGRSAPREEPTSAESPSAGRNEPEEVSFVSIDCSPPPAGAAREGQGDGLLAGDALREDKLRALAGYVNEDVACSMVDVRSPLLIQKQFDAEQKQAQMLQDGGGNTDLQHHTAAPALAADPQQVASTPVPSNAPLAKSQHFAGTTKLLHLSNSGLAGESPDASSFPSSAAHSPLLSSGSARLACDSSLDKMKAPIQETKLPEEGKSSSNFSVLPQKEVVQTPQPFPSDVNLAKPEISGSMRNARPQNPAGMTRNTVPDISRSYQVFSSREEEQLSKPGTLLSTLSKLPEQPARQQPASRDTDPEYSGRSDRFLLSDPIMMSNLSTASSDPGGACNLQPEESRSSSFSKPRQLPSAAVSGPEKDEVPQPDQSSYQSVSSSWDAADVRTHEIHLTSDPSFELGNAVDPRDGGSICRTLPLAPPDLSGERPSREAGSSMQPNGPWNPLAPPRDSGHNASQPRGDGAEDASPYLGLAMAVAFFSIVGLMLYKHLNN